MKAMNWGSPRASTPSRAASPRALSSIAISVGGLVVFLVFISLLRVSFPISSTVGEYFYGSYSPKNPSLTKYSGNQSSVDPEAGSNTENADRSSPPETKSEESMTLARESDGENTISSLSESNVQESVSSSSELSGLLETKDKSEEVSPREEVFQTVSLTSNITTIDTVILPTLDSQNKSGSIDNEVDSILPSSFNESESAVGSAVSDSTNSGSVPIESDCDFYHGKWVFDPLGPSYTNNTCPVITQMQNCQGNGRPDKEYESWRWKPAECDLPRFDAKKFLELMKGKTLAFIGDSVARNQMESLLCLLWQVEVPKNRGNRHMQRWYFRSNSVMIVRKWSSWLVHQTSEPFDFAPKGVAKLHLDAPDEEFMKYLPGFDVVILSSGHWFAKQSVYILNNEIVGGQLWWPDESRSMKVNNIEAFGISTETILTAIATHPNFTGLTIVRSFSPDHYEGGAWNTGGSCTGQIRPIEVGELVENGFTDIMHKKQVLGYNIAVQKAAKKSKLKLMDITQPFAFRHDGHPGPYRSPDPKKITKRGPDGKPPPQDCLHWCMPGAIDTWNEIVLEIIRRDFEGNQNFST